VIKHEISNIAENSIAAELGITCGDFLLSINGEAVRDILDYRFRIQDESLLVEVEKPDGEIWELDIEKDPDEDLGLEFKLSLMSHTKRCGNSCVFCFVDQQPKGLRPSLYVKDDDPRLSFLLGNYVTLTNLSKAEVKRLAGYHLSPLRISVHAADLDVREKMMGTSKARNLFDALDIFSQSGIEMHFQIVLCKGLNDGAQLDYTIEKLMGLNGAKSLAVVPAGLTKHRDGLFPLQPFTKEDAQAVLLQVEKWQASKNFVFLSDEWYILAEVPLPEYKHYGEFPQLDNGVGVLRLFEREFVKGLIHAKRAQVSCLLKSGSRRAFRTEQFPRGQKKAQTGLLDRLFLKIICRKSIRQQPVSIGIVTGTAAGRFMRSIAARFMTKWPHARITVYEIENEFFGPSVTVSGLLAGQDVIKQLKGKLDGIDVMLLPENAFRGGVKQKIMLDGVTQKVLEQKLGIRVKIGSTNGVKFCRELIGQL